MVTDKLAQLPHSSEAEAGVLGCILLAPDRAAEFLAQLRNSHFYEERTRCLFRHLNKLHKDGTLPDTVALHQSLRDTHDLDNAGGLDFVTSLPDKVPSVANWPSFLAILTAKEQRRLVIEAANHAVRVAHDETQDSANLAESFVAAGRNLTMPAVVPSAPASNPWPAPLAAAAIHGPAGEFVRRLEPHTEADPAAILLQTLVAVGNVFGRTAHFMAEADQHFCNVNAVLVGNTSKGRKGTSWGRTNQMIAKIDPYWPRPVSGLSSGEGLIYHVRDAQPDDEDDHGIGDKRLLVMEPEFARVLQSTKRESNTLSAVIRQTFDTGHLRTLTKNSPATATGAHVSIIGHITKQELAKTLANTECANGFANRFLWVCVKRSKLLAEGGNAHLLDFDDLEQRFKRAVEFAKDRAEIRRDPTARELWCDLYAELSDGKPGLLGAVTSRAEALVMRLATIYAILDCSDLIRPDHLRAALAVWNYCEASAAYIFGDSLGDPVADEILRALRNLKPEPMTRAEISDLFKRHRTATEIDRALSTLADGGLARMATVATPGRHAEAWSAL